MNRQHRLAILCAIPCLGLTACGGGGGGTGVGGGGGGGGTTYTVGVTVSGLAGSGLQLKTGNQTLAVAANGAVTFATGLASGASYNVTVAAQPTVPAQTCTVANGNGTIAGANVSNITVTCVSSTNPRYAYSLNFYGGTISTYSVDLASGQLRYRSYAKVGNSPVLGAGDAAGKFVYVLNRGVAQSPGALPNIAATPSTVSAFTHDNVSGELKEIAGSPYAISSTPGAAELLSVHPSGKFVYVTSGAGDNKIFQWSVNATTGQLTPSGAGNVAAGTNPSIAVFDSAGKFAYVTNRNSNDVWVYSVDAATGALTEQSALRQPTGAGGVAFAFDRSGKFGYVVTTETSNVAGKLYGFNVNATTGALTPINATPYPLDINTAQSPPLFHPNGKFIYVRNRNNPGTSGSISAFSIDATSGALTAITAGGPYTTGEKSGSASLDPAGKYLYVVNQGTGAGSLSTGSITVFGVDGTTGALTSLQTVNSISPAPYNGSVDPSGKYFYAPSVDSDQIYSYAITTNSGLLSALPQGGVIRGGAQPISLDAFVSPTVATANVFESRFAYVPNAGPGTLSTYSVDASSGALGVIEAVAAGGAAPQQVAIKTGGKFAYTANFDSNNASSYAIGATTGKLTAIANGTLQTGARPAGVAVDPSGRFVYTVDANASSITTFKTDAATGALIANGAATPTVANPIGILIDPTGRNLYALSITSIQAFSINPANGVLGPPIFGGNGVRTLATASGTHMAIDPRGKFMYVANPGSTSIEVYPLNTYSGELQAGTVQTFGRTNASSAIDPTGRFLYTANGLNGTVSAYSINQSTGALSAIGMPLNVGGATYFLRTDYSGKFLYVTLQSGSVTNFSINQTTGALSAVAGGAATQTNPGAVTTLDDVG